MLLPIVYYRSMKIVNNPTNDIRFQIVLQRDKNARYSLREGSSVPDAALDSGFESLRRPYERSRLHLAMSPGQYARGGKGLALQYQIFESFLGLTLLCNSEAGIAALYLGDSRDALEHELQSEFHAARLEYSEDSVQRINVMDYLQGKRPERMITVHLLGTSFQQEVWAALASIPYGQSRTYSAVARSIGQPRSVRAVARACATNRVALLIPCHRVVGSDGTLRGYRWGKERKAALLAAESME
ncbi:MAG: methylated-DNA--[protein]-cysteine S-methyltransferase [Leptospiraceae bacterium]|nr:methylated-DNA--[protein]-cysteine S-methyltransferase [Leptospiraceae bacterium]